MIKAVGWSLMGAGITWLAVQGIGAWLVGCAGEAPVTVAVVAEAPIPSRPIAELCDAGGSWKRRVYVNVTYEAVDPSGAVALAQRELAHREGEVTYVSVGAAGSSASLNGRLRVGQDLSWIAALDAGRVTGISNSDSPIQPDLDAACERLSALERAEGMAIDGLLGGGDREAVAVALELIRNEVNNTRTRIRSLGQEAEFAQINLYFNPPG